MKKISFLILALFTLALESRGQWTDMKFPIPLEPYQFQWVNKDTLYVIGSSSTAGLLLLSTDQGKSWTTINDSNISHMQWFDGKHGYFSIYHGNGYFFYTTSDGGKTIQPLQIESPIAPNLLSIDFITRHRGFLVGVGESAITTDGGNGWNMQSFAPLQVPQWDELSFADTLHGYSRGTPPRAYGKDTVFLWYTSDGGKTWVERPGYLQGRLSGTVLSFPTATIGFYGLHKTIDGGKTWFYSGNGIDTSGTVWRNGISVHFVDSLLGYATTTYGVYRTLDGGKNWQAQKTSSTGIYGATGWTNVRISFADKDNGIIHNGIVSGQQRHKMWVTTNGGVLGVGDMNKPKAVVKVYPNPASNSLTIEASNLARGNTDVTIHDLLGRTVSEMRVLSDGSLYKTMDVSQFSAGIYILELRTRDKHIVQRIIIQK